MLTTWIAGMAAAAIICGLETAAQLQCSVQSFPLDLGNTHCPTAAKDDAVKSAAECRQACCAAGDGCDTYQWCEAGAACADGFWVQPGALARGGDIDGWPRNTTVAAAEAACAATPACTGLCYKSADLRPGAGATLKIYLKNSFLITKIASSHLFLSLSQSFLSL